MRKIWIIFLMMVLLFVSACSEQTQNEGIFRVGMECGSAPYNWTQSNVSDSAVAISGGQYCDGYDVQIAKIIAIELGKELVIEKISWDGLILSLQSGQIDAIIAGMSPTNERKKEIDFSQVYYLDNKTMFGVVVQANGNFSSGTTLNDFEDALFSAQVGTFHVDLLDQLNGIRKFEFLKDLPTMTVALKSGELDGFIVDSGAGRTISKSNPDLKFIQLDGPEGFVVTESMAGVSVGLKKGQEELLKTINQIIENIPDSVQDELMENAINAQQTSQDHFFKQVLSILKSNNVSFIKGTITTLLVSLSATFFGFIIALWVAITRGNKVSDTIANIYVTFFRGTPMMVQAMVMYYGVSMMIPNFRWSDLPMGNIIAGIIVVSINTGAYMSETVRGGIQAIDCGQFEAASSLGFTQWETMRYIILPQAIKNAIPALGNELIVNVKDTSVLSVIAVSELFFVSNGIASTSYQVLQTFTITSMIYLFLTTVLTVILHHIEKVMDKTKTPSRKAMNH